MRSRGAGRRLLTAAGICAALLGLVASPALACGGLVGPRGSVRLARTTTLAAYHDGVEHYVTSFEFNGTGTKFGSIVPLPGIPSKVEKGGAWTLQRLELEIQPLLHTADVGFAAAAAQAPVQVVLKTRIDALDVTVIRGNGDAVAAWARQQGYGLSPDAPEIFDFYASRSPVFLATSFDASASKARGVQRGDGTPLHLTIPTPNPWVPLRILGLGLRPDQQVQADVFLLTDRVPTLLPAASASGNATGMTVVRSAPASPQLLAGLGSDRGMGWLPRSGMWLTALRIDTTVARLHHDLAVDVSGKGRPSPVAAGLTWSGTQFDPAAAAPLPVPGNHGFWYWLSGVLGVGLLGALLAVVAARSGSRPRRAGVDQGGQGRGAGTA